MPGGATALNRFVGTGSKYIPKFVDNARTAQVCELALGKPTPPQQTKHTTKPLFNTGVLHRFWL